MQSLGAHVEWADDTTLEIHAASVKSGEVPVAFSGLNRIPVLLIGPLLHRYGTASVPLLGGDEIGARPLNYHVGALQQLGATITVEADCWRATANRLKGTLIDLPYPSVGATESALLSSVLAEGTTVIRNAAVEPEIIDTILLLQKMGALIAVEVDRTIVVEGVRAAARRRAPPADRPDRGGVVRGGGRGHRRRRLHRRRRARARSWRS